MKIFKILVAFILLLPALSGCQSASLSGLAARSGAILFWDNFSNASGNWPQISGPDGSLGIVDGQYRSQVLKSQFQMLATPGHAFRDARLEVNARRMSGPLQNLFGLACRALDANNYYFFAISSDGYYALGKIKGGQPALIGQSMMAYQAAILPGEAANHLRLDCIGARLTGSVNGQEVASGEDADFTSGQAGLVAGALDQPGMDVAFDNFVVYKP